jgi:helix-turn-helix protein
MSRAMMEALRTPGLTHAASRFYTYLVGRANGAHYCWPSGEEIARDLGIKTRHTLAAASAELVSRGLIAVKRQFRGTNHYSILDPDGRLYGGEPAKPHETPVVQKPTQLFPDVRENEHLDVQKPTQSNVQKPTQESLSPSKSPRESSLRSDSPRARGLASVEGWAEFWSDYPRKVGKGIAFKAYVRAVKAAGGDFNEVMDALIEAMDEDRRFLGDAQYIPHPSSWLNAGPWHAPDWKPKPSIYATTMEAGHAD